MSPSDSLRSPARAGLIGERSLPHVTSAYLGIDPLIMSVVLWKSFPSTVADQRSAQHFHYDNDRAAFVELFVYLTDVGPVNGPHTYVPRSHRAKPRRLLHGKRLGDAEVAQHYPAKNWREITGPRGTVFFADTQGFHKGGHVTAGERAIFQINLASDRFGVHEPAIGAAEDAPPELRAVLADAHAVLQPAVYP